MVTYTVHRNSNKMNDTFGFIKFFSSSGSYFFFVTTDALLIMMFAYSSSTDLDPICFFLIAYAIKKNENYFFSSRSKKNLFATILHLSI